MSKKYSNDWESALSAPWSNTGGNISLSGTSVIDGAQDLRLSTVGGSGQMQLNLIPPTQHGVGSARGFKIQGGFKIKIGTHATVALLPIFETNGLVGLYEVTAAPYTLRLASTRDSSFTNGATVLTTGTTYQIDVDFRFECNDGIFLQAWLDGVLEVQHRDPAGSGTATAGYNIVQCGYAGAKGAATINWGDMNIWIGTDPT